MLESPQRRQRCPPCGEREFHAQSLDQSSG
jgi:hypothetical protein